MNSNFENRAVYIRENIEFYAKKFSTIESSGSKLSWNWCAFFFTSAWLIYRKIYTPFIIVFALETVILPVLDYALSLGPITVSTGIIINVLMGLFGNYLYMRNIDTLLEKSASMDINSRLAHQEKYGGTSWPYVGIYLVISLVISSFFS